MFTIIYKIHDKMCKCKIKTNKKMADQNDFSDALIIMYGKALSSESTQRL